MQITIADLAKKLGAEAVGNIDLVITGPSEPLDANEHQIALAMKPSYKEALLQGSAKAAILWEDADWQQLGLEAAIYSTRPRFTLSGVTRLFSAAPTAPVGIHSTAIIDPSAQIGKNASIGPFVIIEAGVSIGENARVMSHVSIAEDAKIGDDVLLYNGVRIGARVQIGHGFIAHFNVSIGGDGFSFVTPEAGAIEAARALEQVTAADAVVKYSRIYSLGTVAISDMVEIGANSAIDRGTIANTVIGAGTKIDNLVQIGHNVKVGENCLLCGAVAIGGSTVIGNGVILGGQSGVADNITIGENVVAAGKSGIASNVPPNRTIMGTPAVKMETFVETYKATRRLPRLISTVEALKKRGADDR